jgi:hypothetical protein
MTKFIFIFLSFYFSNYCIAQTNAISEAERLFLTDLLDQSLAKFDKSIANLADKQLNFRSSKNEWTIAECIEHICLAELRFPQIVQEELAKPAKRKKIKITNEKITTRLINRRWKASAPEIFKPTGRFATVKEAVDTFRTQRLKTIDYVKVTNDDLRNHFWKHPATGVIDLYQTIILMSAHLERHIAQIEEIKMSNDFPNL